MANDNDKIKIIYTTLKDGGADVGTEKEFNDWFLASGKDGYENRKSVYDALTDGGADAGRNYEEFRDWLGLHAVDGGAGKHVVHGDDGADAVQSVAPAQQPVSPKPQAPQQQDKQEPGFFSRLWQSAKDAFSSAGQTGPEGHAVAAGAAISNMLQQGSAARQPAQQRTLPPNQPVSQTQKNAQQAAQAAPKQDVESGQVSPQDAWRNQPITVGYLTKGQHDTTQGAVFDQMYKDFESYYNNVKPGQPSAIRFLRQRAMDYGINEGNGGLVVTPGGNKVGDVSTDVINVTDPNGTHTEVMLGSGKANELADSVLNSFLRNKARAAAEELAKKIPFSDTDTAMDSLRANYYNSDYQRQLWDIAGKSGVSYKHFIDSFMKPALDDAIKSIHNGMNLHVGSLFSDWNYAADEGKEYDPNALNADERKLYDVLMTDFDQRLSADRATARGKANELAGRETASNLAIGGREGHAMQLGVPMETLREYNAYADPIKAVNYVLDKLMGNGGGNVIAGGNGDGINRQALGNLLYRKIMDKLVQERIPKSKWGYVLKGFMDGDIGELFKNYTQTDFERHLDNLADKKYMQSLKGFSGMLATGGHEATKFLSDAWEYYLGGKVGSAVTGALRKRAIKRFAADLVERGIQRNVAEGIAARAFQRTAQNAGRKAVMGAVHGAGTMGTAGAISGTLRQSISPAAGEKMDEILQRKANGEQISKQQEAQEIAEANKEAHSITSVLGAGAKGGLSGAVAGMTFGPGTYVGETVSKWASKYMGDLASAATGYTARLGTNAASATALGQAEGAITGEKPEGSIGNQFAQNLVTFAMLDAQGAAPRMLNGHPIKSYRAWKEYERSYGISTEDQQRMRDAGYGDLIDTIDGIVSERFRDRGSSTLPNSGWKPQEESTRINEGMMKLLSDATLPEELKRKYYSLVTGDDSKQLSPIVASEVTTDEDGNHYLVTYNKYGNVVSDRQYHNEKSAQDAQMKIGHEQDENLTDALQQGVFAKDADALMEHAYHAAVEAFKNGDGSLGKGQQTLLYLYQNKDRLTNALVAAGTGEPLTESDQRLVSLFNTVQKQLFEHDANSHDGNIYNIARAAEAANGLASNSLYVARKGHTQKEAKKLAEENGEEAIHIGGDVWRTASEDAAVKDYQQRLYDYMSGIEEGQGAEVKEPGEEATAQQQPTEPSAPEVADATQQQPTEPTGQQNHDQDVLNKLQERRNAGYERGMGIDSDKTQLVQIQHDIDLANQRFNQAFGDGNMNAFRNGMIDAVKNDDEDAMRKLLDKYEGQLSDEQREATYSLIEIGAVQNGIDDSIASQTMEYHDQRQQELADISDAQGNITRLTLDDGTTVYLKNGDITNQYGGVMVVDENGETKQIPVSSIKQAEEPVSAQQQLYNDTNAFAEDLKTGYQRLASGADMLPGQQADINISGQKFHVTADRELEDGRYQLIMDDGSPIVLTSDETQQAVAAARNESVSTELANQQQQRAAQETEARRTKGIVGYAEGKPDLGASETDPAVAGEYLRQKQAEDGKDPLPSIESEIEALKSAQQQAQQDLDRHEQWMEINGDLYTPEDKANKESIIEQRKKEIADTRQRIRKLGEVRNAYMSQEQRMKFRNDRMRKSEEARKTAFTEWQKAQDTEKPKQATVDGIDNKTLLDNYATQADAEDYLQRRREEILRAYRAGASNTIADVQRHLQDYTNGLEELTDDDLKSLFTHLAEAKEQERVAMEQAKQIKAQQQKLGTLYKERNKAELDKMEPADRRAVLLKGARTPAELLKKAHEAYKGSDFESRLDDLEPETLEEYVSQNLGYGTLNWEGTGTGISKKNGLKQELGLTRGIGHGFDSNGINAYLAPKGQGMSVDMAAHKMWKDSRGTQFDSYDDQDFKNAILDLLGSSQKATDIKYLTIRNRIKEVEDYERAQEEQERWYKEQEDEELKKRQQDIDMYNDYLNAIAESNTLTPEQESYLDGLYADEIAEAEQEEAEREAAWEAYEAEKEEEQLKQNNDERTATETNGSGSEVDSQSEPRTDDSGDGKSEETVPDEAAHQPAAKTEHHAQREAGDGTAHTPAGDSDADGGVSLSAQKLKEIKKRASQFSAETEEESGAFGRLIPKMSDEELLAYMRLDGNGDPNEAYHPELYDEYDSRHNDEEVEAYNSYLQQLRDSGTTTEQADDMLAKVQGDFKTYGATDERSMLNGQQDALIDYISELNHQEEEKSPSKEQGKGQMEMHEVDTDKLFKDLKADKTATLSDYYKDEGGHSIGATDTPEKVTAERQNVNTEPTEGQKEAGNYKKGHIKVDGYDITIENPKGSTRSGKDASGKAWSVPMHYDYGYIKGTEGVDGDHIDVYLSDEPTKGNVYVVDQVNQKDGSFDEHKVMYGFPSMEAAVDAYKGQYEDGWKVGTVTEVSREDFKKWVESSHRKTKPFADYKSMETAAKQQRKEPSVPDIKPIGSGDFGPIYDQFKDKPNEAVKFLMSQKDGEALGALHHKEIGGISIVWGNAKAGLQKIAHKHPEVLGNLQDILDGMHVVRSSDNRVKLESGTHFAVVSRDWLGKEHTPWLLTAFEKKESSANNNSMDTAETLDGKRNDTATPQDTAFNGKDSKKNNTKQEKDEKKVVSSQPKELSLFDEEEPTTGKPYYPIENGRRQVSKGIDFPVGWSLPTKDGRNIKVTKVLPDENRREVSWTDGEGKVHSEEMTTDALQHLADVAFGFADDNTNQNNYGKDNTENAGGAGADGGADRPLGPVRPSRDGVLGSSELGRADAGEVGGDTKAGSGLADGQPGGLSAVGSRGGATVNADSGDTASSVVGGRRHGVSTGVRPDGEGHSDRGTDGRPGASERPLRVSVRPGADASGSDSGESPERRASSEEGAGVRGLLAGQEKSGKPARDEATATTRTDDGSKKTASERNTPLNTRNYLYPKDGADIDNMSAKDRLATNVDALETLARLVHEGRTANAEERNTLGKFRGWGGVDMTDVWNVDGLLRKGRKWNSSRQENVTDVANPYYRLGMVIKSLDPDGKRGVFDSIKQAALTSYYTPLPIARAMNEFLSLAGYKGGGSMLDPSIGNGVFEGTMPKDMQQRTQIYGVELDWLTAQIAKNLYPDAHIQQSGYQEAELCKDAFDVVESNIPFGSIKVYDPTWRHDSSPAKKAAQGKIHTYFALKMMENAKPGGLVTIMTSNSIMDTPGNGIIRDALLEQGEFLGAVRLPDNTFKGAGTRVVTDVIFMRKYKDEDDRATTLARDGYAEKQQQFSNVDTIKAHNASEGKDYDVRISGYYKANPKMMLGKVVAGGQYRGDEFGLTSEDDTNALAKKMLGAIKKEIVGDRAGQLYDTHKSERKVYHAIRETYVGDGSYQSNGNIVEQNGKFGVLHAVSHGDVDMGFDFEENPKLNRFAARIRLYIPVRTALKKLIAAQINREPEKVIEGYRKELNSAYKVFRNRYGLLNDKANNFIAEDIDSYQMLSLEDIDEDTKKLKGLADIFTKNTIKPTIDTSKVKDPASAIATSLAQYGEVRPSFMEKVLGKDWPTLCGDTLYKVPFSESYVVSDDYLSGDVKSKLEDAKRAAEEYPAYKRNVEALEKVQPRDIPVGEINIRMGARWVPDKVYTDFMKKMFGIPDWDHVKSGVRYIPESDDYIINVDRSETGIEADKWATDRRSAKDIFEAAMKDRSLKVYDHHSDGSTSLNKAATELANSKVQDLRETFETWVTSDPERADALGKMYNEKFNRTVIRQWSAPFLQSVGLQGMTLRPHQQAAVWMLLNNRGGIVDHIVGAGKTLVMQSAIMEMRRMGIAKKPMIIALKATVGQIAKEFAQAYPAAKILAPTEKDFVAKNRKKLFAQIATNDYDCVIVSHDNYVKFGHTKEIESQTLREQLQQLEAAIMLMRTNDVNGRQSQLTKRQLKGLEKRKANLEARMKRIMDRPTDKEFCFENLGVDYLFVDECQRFKSLPYATTYNQVAGLGDPTGSTKAVALLNGVRYLQQLHQGDRGTVFLSGTTITNSLVEVYNLLNYLRPNMMKKLGYTTFDAWAAQFAVRSSELEYGVTNELKEKNRFRYFQNVSELGKMYAEIADVRNDYNLKLPKPKPRTHLVTIEPSDDLDIINEQIVNMVKTKDGSFFGIDGNDKTPWSLQASNLSTKASVSPRLVDPSLPDDPHGKLATACENVAKIYKQFDAQKGTQLIFCDTGVPSKGKEYDAYTDIINRLVNDYGIPRKEIVDIHTANTDDKRKALFKKVRDGQVRILIGGTVNMGTGVNVQSRLVALHHIDIPWQPADTEQRNGRGVRQGNIIARDFNDNNVDIYYYAVKGTLDTYRYQLQDIKGKMFAQFKLNTIDSDSAREFDEGEIDADGEIDPAQMVAMLSGNPVIFEKSKQDKLVKKLRRQESSEYNDYLRRKRNIESLKSRKESFENYQRMNNRDKEFLERNGYDPPHPANDYKIIDGSGKEYPWKKATDAGKIIHKLWKSAKPFTLKGYGMEAHLVQNSSDLFGGQTILKPVSNHWALSDLPYSVPLSDTDQAAGQAFANLVKSIYHSGDAYKAELDKLTHKLEGSDKIGEFQFSKQKQLEEALAKKKELDAEYQKLSDETNNEAEQETGEPQGSQDSGDDGALYRMADEEEAAKLDKEPTVKVYRAMQLINGKLYPPMMAAVKGKLVEPRELGQWEVADERPGIIEKIKKNKAGEEIGYVTLDKGSKDSTGKKGTPIKGVAYNPYWHTSRSPLNDQFKSAWIRPNIVTVEVEVPVSELRSGYRAKYAKDPVGETDWHSGSVTKQLTAQGHSPRKVILSRYDKPVRILSAAETAERIIDYIGDYDVTIPENVVTPQVRVELEKRGIKIGAPEKGVKKTEQIREAIERGLSVSDDMLRDSEVFDDGERLPIYVREGGYGVSGLNNDYRKLSDLLDAFRDKYPQYVATFVDSKGEPVDPDNLITWKFNNPGDNNDVSKHLEVPHGLSIQVEPWRKYLSAPYKGAAQNEEATSAQNAYVARKTRNALAAVKHWADKMNLGDKVTVLTNTDGLQGKKARAKGWFVPKDGKITIVLPNHTDVGDVIRTLLHEGVAHYGLRQLFGKHFDTFLDNVYNNANHSVKSRIRDLELKYDGDKHKATEEYLAGLAEDTDFEHTANSSWWSKIKNMFLDMLAKVGLKLRHALTDADLRYVLWRSYENMKHPGEKRTPADGHLNEPIEEIEGEREPREAAAQRRPTEQRGNVAADMNRRGMSTREFSEQEKMDMGNAAEELGETLGGVAVTIEHNGKDGVKGSFDTRDNTVHVNMDEADGIEDVEATVCHEVLGHEGLKALFGSNKGVDMFGQFIYDNASKELRRKIVEKADEEGYEWTDPLRFSKAAQEVFSDIASDGPRNAEEFSLWRKVKHYVIRALKSLGIRIRGIVNDHDLRYYVLKTGKAVKKWSMMDEETQREAAEPGRIMYSHRGKPRKRKDESWAHYIERLRTDERWKQAEKKAKAANDPMPEKEDYDQQAQDEYNKAMDDWRKSNNIQPGDKEPSEFPKRKDGESPQEYAIRVADYESQSDIWKTAPNMFDYMKKAQDEYHAAYEAWKTRYDLQEMESVDEKLYSGEPIPSNQPQTDEQHYDQLEVDHAVEQDAERELGDAVGMDLSAEGAQRHAQLAVIERCKKLESASAEDALFIHDLCKDIDALAKKKDMKPAELREKLIDVIEAPVAQQDADKEVDKWVDVLNNMRAFQDAHASITADGVKAAMPELNALSHLYVKYGVKPSSYEQRKEIHEAAKTLADKFNDYYKDTAGYNQLFGDDIMQVGKYIVKMSEAAYAAAAASKLGEDPDVKAIVDRIHDWYDNFYHVIEDAGLRGDAGYVENGYINHIWDKEKSDADAWEKYVENYQRTKSGNMRHRTISTYADGIEVGLVPKFNDVAQIMSYYSRQNNEAIANKKFLDDLSFLTVSELNKDGEVVRTLPVLNSHHPSRFDEERYKMYHVPGVGDVWVLNEVSRRFSSIFGTMRTQDIPDWLSKTGKVYDLLGSTMKKIQLSISGFHALALTEVAIAQMGPINGVRWAVKSLPIELKPLLMLKELFKGTLIDSIKNGTIPAYARPEDFKFAASHLVQLGATQDYAAADVNMITERFRNYVRGLRKDEAFVKQAAGGALTPLAVALDFINKGMDKLLWNYLHDGLKIACFKWIAERVDKMVEKRGLTAEQRERLLDEAGQYVNDTFGGQYWELLNLSPAALKWMRRALLSPDWFVSTLRHFFANFGYGSIYDTRSFGEYVKESLRLKRAASQQLPTEPSEAVNDNGDIYRILRSTLARLCYVVGVCVFYNSLMNGLNTIMKAWDEEKEKEKADEIRKTNPDYKSPYELAYPDGMKWYDYTMFGNSLGQQTHLFLGRYADGTEMYVRWGKQFREFPEMFIGRKGLDFPAPMIQRMMGKANPVIGLIRDNLGALGIWGFENQNDIEEIQAKYGKAIGLLAMNARHFIPYSLPTKADKEFKMMDVFMPSSKGFTRYKTVDYFKDFIKSGDMEGVARVYRAATMNGIDVEKCLQAAITTLKAEQRDEMSDGIRDLSQAVKRYDAAKTLKEKKVLKNKLTKYLAAESYKAFTRDEAMQMIEDYMNGDNVAEKDNDRYIELSNSGDIRADYRLSAIGKQAKKFVGQIKAAQSSGDASTAKKLAARYDSWIEINTIINQERSSVNKLKKQLGKGNDKAVMHEIREVRKQAQQLVDALPAPK